MINWRATPHVGEEGHTAFLEFSDNAHLLDLCGHLDVNLSTIEREFGITVARRGNRIELYGPRSDRLAASRALTALAERLETGRPIEAPDVQTAVRLAGENAADADAAAADTTLRLRTATRLVEPRTVAQRQFVEAINDSELVFGVGTAGTGKTYLAVAAAVAALLEKRVERIVLSRPAVEAGERLGFLPGDIKDKFDPYLLPLYDALYSMLTQARSEKLMAQRKIEIAPLAFMRGRTLADAFVVLDEAQNCSVAQMKMFLTRFGKQAQMVVTGDLTQIDLPRGMESGLTHAYECLRDIEGVAFVQFDGRDTVRHPLVSRIVKAYEQDRCGGEGNGRGNGGGHRGSNGSGSGRSKNGGGNGSGTGNHGGKSPAR